MVVPFSAPFLAARSVCSQHLLDGWRHQPAAWNTVSTIFNLSVAGSSAPRTVTGIQLALNNY